jgi:transcriptional regulator with XRE-family HTH domain
VLSEGRTTPPEPVRLADLRRIVGLTQSEVAARAGVKQANVSRAESRDDVLVSTIMSLVAAMGCKMTMNARLPNGTSVRILIGKDASILSPDIQPAKAVGQRKKGRPTQIDHTTRLKSPKRRQHQAPPKTVAE